MSINNELKRTGRIAQEVTVFLRMSPDVELFKCPKCGSGIIKHNRGIMALVYGNFADFENPLTAPYSVQCHNCGTIYHFTSFVR